MTEIVANEDDNSQDIFESEPTELSLFDALVSERASSVGGMSHYAARLGVAESTLWRWKMGRVDLLNGRTTSAKQRLVDDLGFSLENLQRLAEMPVTEACILIIEAAEAEPESAS